MPVNKAVGAELAQQRKSQCAALSTPVAASAPTPHPNPNPLYYHYQSHLC